MTNKILHNYFQQSNTNLQLTTLALQVASTYLPVQFPSLSHTIYYVILEGERK